MLLKSGEVGAVAADGPPELDRSDGLGVGRPHLPDQVPEPFGNVAFEAERVFAVQLEQVAIAVEVLRQDLVVRDALQRCVPVDEKRIINNFFQQLTIFYHNFCLSIAGPGRSFSFIQRSSTGQIIMSGPISVIYRLMSRGKFYLTIAARCFCLQREFCSKRVTPLPLR